MSSRCFHCDEPVPAGASFTIEYQDQTQTLCCLGCQAVAEAIISNGLDDYYKYRTAPAEKGEALVPEELRQLSVLDDDQLQQSFIESNGEQQQITLCIEGITCAACAWLIEHQVGSHPAVTRVQVNTTTERAQVSWQPQQASLSELLVLFRKIGYRALPFQANQQEAVYQKQSKAMIRRLGLVGLATMQIMMIAIGLYFGVFQDIEPAYRDYLRGISWLLATPVVFYGARPFFTAAYHSLRVRRLVMDVPVSLAIGGAYLASTWATFTRQGEVYFESISMFTFFLLIGRYMEMRARRRAIESSSNLLKQLPVSAMRLDQDNNWQGVPAVNLQAGDVVLIRPGELVPADGEITVGTSSLDESMLTGEHTPVLRKPGDQALAGTINIESPLQLIVRSAVADSRLSNLLRLQEEALQEKPQTAALADRLSRWFTLMVLVISAATAVFWWFVSPEDSLWITLSVLVATCPCALALATPAALTCATAALSRRGIMLRSGNALEQLTSVDSVVFDKTGTLTEGRLHCAQVTAYAELSEQQLLSLAEGLERFSEHPIATAFTTQHEQDDQRQNSLCFTEVTATAGMGLQGRHNQEHYRIGRWAHLQLAAQEPELDAHSAGLLPVYLSRDNQLVGRFLLDDTLRPQSESTVQQLNAGGWQPTLLTGDPSARGPKLAEELNMQLAASAALPEQKLDWIRQAQHADQQLLMVGDGINDAPVLAAADVSVAMGDGSDLAKSSADILLLSNNPAHIVFLLRQARLTQRVIRQNMAWALGYNAVILPLAVSGLVVPWLAALGMSLSSVLVVSNSLRLLPSETTSPQQD